MRLLFLLFLLISQLGFSQQFADKNYYLIDSLDFEELSSPDRRLIDSCLTVYHNETVDTSKVVSIRYLVENCWDEKVWPKYNWWLYELTKEKIKEPKYALFYKTQYAAALNNIGYYLSNKSIVREALDYYHQSLKIQQEINDLEGVSTSLNNIGAVYSSQGDVEEALKYCIKSLALKKLIGSEYGLAMSYNNIGSLYNTQGETKNALEYFLQALEIRKKLGDKLGEGTVLNNIGEIYLKQKELDQSLVYFNDALTILEEVGSKKLTAISLKNIGEVYLKKGELKKAEQTIQKAFVLSKKVGYPKGIANTSLLLSKIAIQQQDYKKTYDMYTLHVLMLDSMKNIETQKAAIQQQTKYEYESRKAIDDLKNEKLVAIEKQKKEQQKVITYVIAISLIIVALFLGFIFNRLQITKKQKFEIEKQKQIVETAHKEITDSIKYAKRLQNAILPSFSEINNTLKNNFILFKPKNVVSGDFYWFEHKLNNKYTSLIAAADCTGHGVPGAMVSVACSNALHRSVNEFGIIEPSKILDKTRELVIATFAKSGENIKDGMDITLCAFSDHKVVFSGANNPLWIVRSVKELTKEQLEHRTTVIIEEKALIEFKGDRQPVGLHEKMIPFTQTEIELVAGDLVYLFTDGFPDQFGGEKGKKIKYKAFKKILIENSNKTMLQQKEILNLEFNNWKGNLEQVDDICIIGIKTNTKS